MKKYLFSLLLILMVTVPVHSQDMDKMSMDSKHESVYNNMLNTLTSGNLEMLDKYVAPDFIEHDPGPMMTKKTGIERIKEDFASYHKIFPDMKSKVHNIAVTGDMLFAYITFTGTSAESFMGMPANHKMTMNMVDLVRFKGDKIAEHWGFTSNEDMMKMMPQDKMSQNKMMDKEMK